MLWLLRHAEAADGLPDDERPLTERGIRQAEAAGPRSRASASTLDVCLTSPKLRAVQTAERPASRSACRSRSSRRCPASRSTSTELIAGLGDVLLVGHDPSFSLTAPRPHRRQARMRRAAWPRSRRASWSCCCARPNSAAIARRTSGWHERHDSSRPAPDADNRGAGDDGRATASRRRPSSRDPALYINRELSWLDFNDRVLQLAEDESLPLIERLKFLAIFVTNLDEFFMVRVAGVHDQIEARIDARGPDGLSPAEVLRGDRRAGPRAGPPPRPPVHRRGPAGARRARHPDRHLRGVRRAGRAMIERHFREQIFPVLTPLAIGPGRPFPYISNLSLSLIVRLHDPDLDHEVYARVKVPKEVLPRFVEISQGHVHPARGHHRPPPRRAVPGDGDHQLRPVPGHARRRLRGLRRGRRPAPGGRGRAPAPALRRGRAARGRREHGSRAARAADRVAGRRRGPGLRRRGHARPRRPVADRRGRRPSRAAPAAMDAAHPSGVRPRPGDRDEQPDMFAADAHAATCSSTTPTSRSRPASSGSSSRRSTTRTCWRSR